MRHAVLHALHISTFVLLWYVLSISLTLYNKWLFAVYGLRLPLLITALHFALKVPLARVAMACRGLRAPPLDWRTVAARIVPTGAATRSTPASAATCAGDRPLAPRPYPATGRDGSSSHRKRQVQRRARGHPSLARAPRRASGQ